MKTIFDAAFFKFLLGFIAVIFAVMFLLGETRNYADTAPHSSPTSSS